MPVANSFARIKRILVGRPFRSDHFRREALPKRFAMPIFASDMLSSVAYAPDAIVLTLSISGFLALNTAPWIGIAVGVLILILVGCYRLNLRAYPSGGADYEVASKNLGPRPGRAVAAALLVDYVLTLSVSMTVLAAYTASAIPVLQPYVVIVSTVAIGLVTLFGLRGGRAMPVLLAIPTYLFIAAVIVTVGYGAIRLASGDVLRASTADLVIMPLGGFSDSWQGAVVVVMILRAFSSGLVAVAGVETVANAVPKFAKPRGVNAGNTLLITGVLSAAMLVGLTWLATVLKVKYVSNPAQQLLRDGEPVGQGFHQVPVLAQSAAAVFDQVPVIATAITLITALVLLVAANTAMEGFPGLASRLARDSYLPRQLAALGDRMTFSNGVVLLSVLAIILVIATQADSEQLIDMYLVGVLASFALGQWGMVRHWSDRIRSMISGPTRTRMMLNRLINAVGAITVGVVLLVVLISKFLLGAWVAVALMAASYVAMGLIHRHYTRVARELNVDPKDASVRALPPRTRAVVVVSEINKPTMRAIAFARANRPRMLSAVAISVDEDQASAVQEKWDQLKLPIELTLLDSPYRELIRPIMNYIAHLHAKNPDDLITVYVPQYIVGRWWEQLLHNQTLLGLRTRLLFLPNVQVVTVPWRLKSFNRKREHLMGRGGHVDERVMRMYE